MTNVAQLNFYVLFINKILILVCIPLMYNIKDILCRYLISKVGKNHSILLQLGCSLVPHLFIFGALMDRVLNWQRNNEF
jgi:uncharacterized integral membrane protein